MFEIICRQVYENSNVDSFHLIFQVPWLQTELSDVLIFL